MSTFDLTAKPLPPPARDEKLPPPPPPELRDSRVSSPPPPPSKLHLSPHHSPALDHSQTLHLPSSDSGLTVPFTPTTPTSPTSVEGKSKKPNPLLDLIDTEKAYVDNLTGIIRKVAAAWSRSNLPPPDLDTMFRSIEGVYKANRSLHSKLKEIGANPSSPKALGDLLMRWIDDLEGPYTAYCTKYCCGFDTWEPVQSNPRLVTILSTFSASNPPPASSSDNHVWTLDGLFLLPKARLKYYKKLYSRLLKSTTSGRSDHRLLLGALDTLDKLLATLEARSSVEVGQAEASSAATLAPVDADDEVVIDMRSQTLSPKPRSDNEVRRSGGDTAPGSESGSARGSSVSGGERLSRETASTSISRASVSTLSMPISSLERRLTTQRTLDIFTMKPKLVKLQMTPPSLTFTREMRMSLDVVIRFTPRATGVEVVHRQGHIFLLSDLFLICERMTPEEQAQNGDGADMWLCYPPLAGKVLRISDTEGLPENGIQIAIMRKEFLIIQADSAEARNNMLTQFKECIEFSGSLPPPSKQPPPPVPSINGAIRMQTAPIQSGIEDKQQRPQGSTLISSSTSSPMQGSGSSPTSSPQQLNSSSPSQSPHPPTYQNEDGGLADSISRMRMSPDAKVLPGVQRLPSIQGGPQEGSQALGYFRTSASAQPFGSNPAAPFGPGQVMPPARSTSVGGGGYRGPPGPGPGYPPNPAGGQSSQPGMSFNSSAQPNYPGQLPHTGQLPTNYGGQPSSRPGQQPPFPVTNNQPNLRGLPPGALPPRPPSEPLYVQGGVRKTPSTRSLASQYSQHGPLPAPPMPSFAGGIPRSNSYGNLHAPQPRTLLPSAAFNAPRAASLAEPSFDEPSPPGSPVHETPQPTGPVTSTISAQMKCKVFLKQQHAQWKALGSAKLKLYRQDPTNVKQLVVEAENKDKSILISTIVLTDGVERVGKTGVAIELSDKGARTGIVYMIQLRNEKSAGGLFDSLLAGSDRSATRV